MKKDELKSLFTKFSKNKINAYYVKGGLAAGTCDGSNCCQETKESDPNCWVDCGNACDKDPDNHADLCA
jgi:hypothetical protein